MHVNSHLVLAKFKLNELYLGLTIKEAIILIELYSWFMQYLIPGSCNLETMVNDTENIKQSAKLEK